MNNLRQKTAESMIRKTWTEAMGRNNPTKKHFKKVIKEFYPSWQHTVNILYDLLESFIKRKIHISELNIELLIQKKSKNTRIQKNIPLTTREAFKQKLDTNFMKYTRDNILPCERY